jgi:hypothetical protein
MEKLTTRDFHIARLQDAAGDADYSTISSGPVREQDIERSLAPPISRSSLPNKLELAINMKAAKKQ